MSESEIEDVSMEEAIAKHFRGWVKGDIWLGPSSEKFYQALKRVFDEIGMMSIGTDDFAEGIEELIDELQPDSDREYVTAIIDECCERIRVLNAFFDANDVYGLETP